MGRLSHGSYDIAQCLSAQLCEDLSVYTEMSKKFAILVPQLKNSTFSKNIRIFTIFCLFVEFHHTNQTLMLKWLL